ncbi:type ISP restriction/modification enzyme [Streptomyces sp. NPDC001941]|uniref:type ISP restriction/modification enzyme n=1 Tax=Streptomyces sp. NPDC001941 TaxID=3154659 RepID=UPI003319A8EB
MLLDDLMPWSTPPLRYGRSWVVAPDSRTLRSRWDALLRAGGEERAALFQESRARTLRTSVAALPGHSTGTGQLAGEAGPCPEPVRIAHGPFDEQWLLPDHRLIDAARPELWRVADEHQLFAVEQGYVPGGGGPAVLVSAVLPDGRSPAGRPGRIRPLYRRPGGTEPNLAPGLLDLLTARYRLDVAPEDVLAWVAATARAGARGSEVPLPADPAVWARGVARGQRLLTAQLRGARGGGRPRLPGGRRPYVRQALPARPRAMAYDPAEEVLSLDEGRVAPVPRAAWDFRVAGVRVLELWFERRVRTAEPGTLDAVGGGWTQEWTSQLLELITVLALVAAEEPVEAADDLGPLPSVPPSARRPASVLDHLEEGPGGQFALL